jgi:glycosyltransferase involved in cell wall biosynthesis
MRILFVLASRGAGGAEILVRDLAIELRRKGAEIGIAFISRTEDLGGSPEFQARYQATLDAASVRTFDLGHVCRRNPFLGAVRLYRIIRQFRPHVLHIHLQFGLLFRLLLGPLRIATVYTHHQDRFRRGKLLFCALALRVDHHVAISRQTENLLRAAVGDSVTRIVNAVAFPRGDSRPKSKALGGFQVISAGGLRPEKDFSTLIRIAAVLLEDRPDLSGQVRFLIAGDGPERAKLESQIRETHLGPVVSLLGIRTDVPALMAVSKLFLMTSRSEGLPMTLLEALHAGLPIVATDVGGVSEVVEHGKNGLLASAGDAEALAAHLRTLIYDPNLRARFGRASLEKAQQFSIEANAEQHLALYRRVQQGTGR